MAEDSANETAVTLGLSELQYYPGDMLEGSQTLTYTITGLAGVQLFKSDGTTEVHPGGVLTIWELRGLKYKTIPDYNYNGPGGLIWEVTDNGGTANGGVDTLTETLPITVWPVNDAPFRIAPEVLTPINVAEDSANATAVSLGLSELAYSPGGRYWTDESSQTLTYTIAGLAGVQLFKSDGTTEVARRYPHADRVAGAEVQDHAGLQLQWPRRSDLGGDG